MITMPGVAIVTRVSGVAAVVTVVRLPGMTIVILVPGMAVMIVEAVVPTAGMSALMMVVLV